MQQKNKEKRHLKWSKTYKMDQPFKQFISGLLDLTIIKPLIEMSTGTEMITNEDLTDTEKLYKGIGAIIDISTLGYAMVARKAIGGAISASRVLFLESVSNGAAYLTAYAGDKLNLPVAITMLLTLGVGIKVSKQGSKFVVKPKTDGILGKIADVSGDKSLFDITETLLKTGDAKTVGSVLDTFDIKSMSKEEINSLYDTLSKGKLTKVEIERFQETLMKNIEADDVPEIIGGVKPVERIIPPKISRMDYLRGKYGKLSSLELNERINTRGINEEARISRLAKVVRRTDYTYNMIENPGPLAKIDGYPSTNFYGGRYNPEVLTEDRIYYRSGQTGKPLGQWFTSEPVESVAKVRIDAAVKEQWIDSVTGEITGTSILDTNYAIKIPKGTTVYKGPVGYQGGVYLGGEDVIQTFIQEPWKLNVEVISKTTLK